MEQETQKNQDLHNTYQYRNLAIDFIGTKEQVLTGKATIFYCIPNFCDPNLGIEMPSLVHLALDSTNSMWKETPF